MANPSKLSNKKYCQGYYKIQNPEKYMGNPNKVSFRSSWEYSFMVYLDNNPKIIKWGSETVVIPYTLDGKIHRYYSDFYYEILKNDDNLMEKVIVEIKPMSEVFEPKRPKNETLKSMQNYEYSILMWMKNRCKWDAAISFAKQRSMTFVVITEEHLKKAGILKS